MGAMADFAELHNATDISDEAWAIAAPVLEASEDQMDVDHEASEDAHTSKKQ